MASVGLSLFCVGSTGGRICLVFTSGPHPELRTHSLPGHGCHQGMVQEGHTVPSRTALELPVTGASERMTSWPCHPSLALEPWRNGAGFRARAADGNLKAFMLLSEAALVPSLAFPMVGARAGGQDEEPEAPRCAVEAIRRWLFGASQHWPQPGLALEKREAGEKRTWAGASSQLL